MSKYLFSIIDKNTGINVNQTNKVFDLKEEAMSEIKKYDIDDSKYSYCIIEFEDELKYPLSVSFLSKDLLESKSFESYEQNVTYSHNASIKNSLELDKSNAQNTVESFMMHEGLLLQFTDVSCLHNPLRYIRNQIIAMKNEYNVVEAEPISWDIIELNLANKYNDYIEQQSKLYEQVAMPQNENQFLMEEQHAVEETQLIME